MTQVFQGSESWMRSSPLQGEISPEEQLAWAQVKKMATVLSAMDRTCPYELLDVNDKKVQTKIDVYF